MSFPNTQDYIEKNKNFKTRMCSNVIIWPMMSFHTFAWKSTLLFNNIMYSM